MLQHRLPLDDAGFCNWTSALPPRDVASVPRVNFRAAARILIAYDLLCALLYLYNVGLVTAPPLRGALALSFCVTVAVGAIAGYATGLYDKATLVKGRSLPALAVLVSTASFLPALLLTLICAMRTHHDLLPPMVCAAAAILSVAAGHIAWRICVDRLLRRGCCLDRLVVIAETASEARVFAASIEQRSFGRLRAIASFATCDAEAGACFAWIENAVRNGDADQIVLVQSRQSRPAERGMIFRLVRAGADVTVMPNLGAAYRVSDTPTRSPDLPPMDVPMPPLGGWQAGVKRALDIVVAAVAVVITFPVCLLIALAIKLDRSGPIFFKQTRHGADGNLFRIWKFRTMYGDQPDQQKALQTRRDDPRVTQIGRFLRRSSLDELPQLANVILGDMSIVGPRPHAVGMLVAGELPERILHEYGMRHRMKPGITGWAQVHGSRGELDTPRALRRRFALDRHYIENWSLGMDIMIILRTVALPFIDRHAF